jgi:hypothetical protein
MPPRGIVALFFLSRVTEGAYAPGHSPVIRLGGGPGPALP